MMRIFMIIIIICLGYGALQYFSGRNNSDLDYGLMNSKDIPREWLETPYQLCIQGHERDEWHRKLCACHSNAMLCALSKEEFIEMNKNLEASLPIPVSIDTKIRNSAIACKQKFLE